MVRSKLTKSKATKSIGDSLCEHAETENVVFLIKAHPYRLLGGGSGQSMWEYILTHVNKAKTVQVVKKNIQL